MGKAALVPLAAFVLYAYVLTSAPAVVPAAQQAAAVIRAAARAAVRLARRRSDDGTEN